MKKIGLSILVVMSLILHLSGCATVPPREQMENANYGNYPNNYQEIIKEYYSRVLFDPYSAHYRWIKSPYKGYFSALGKFNYGYVVHVGINAKNRLGGYVGEKQEAVLIHNDAVINAMPLMLMN